MRAIRKLVCRIRIRRTVRCLMRVYSCVDHNGREDIEKAIVTLLKSKAG
jgi:hypothetical protein